MIPGLYFRYQSLEDLPQSAQLKAVGPGVCFFFFNYYHYYYYYIYFNSLSFFFESYYVM